MNLLKRTIIIVSAALTLWGCSDDDEASLTLTDSITLSANLIQTNKDGGNIAVTVTSSGDWRLSGTCDWAHPSERSGKSGDVVIITIFPNPLDEKRTATFKFFTGSSVAPLQVESEIAYVMNLLSDEKLSISKEEGSAIIQLSTNIAEPAITFSEGSEEWLSFDKRQNFADKSTFLFQVTKNETYKDRSAVVTIASPLVAEPVRVNLTQERTKAIIPETKVLMCDLAARTVSFNLKYNVDYTISVAHGSEWITDQSTSEPLLGDDGLSTITLTYKLGESAVTRGGTIRISDSTNTINSELSIIQKNPDIELIEIPDNTLRSICAKNGWILPIIGAHCVLLEAGMQATSFSNTSYNLSIADLTGIEHFTNLTSLKLGGIYSMKKLDISGLHKVTSLSINYPRACMEYDLGDNPILSFNAGGIYSYSYATSITVISSKLETLNLNIQSFYGEYYDTVTSIDVSACPALTTLNTQRGRKMTKLYLKTGQSIPNLTKHDTTEIIYR